MPYPQFSAMKLTSLQKAAAKELTPHFYPDPTASPPTRTEHPAAAANGPTQAELEASMRELLRSSAPDTQARQRLEAEQQQQQDPMLALLQQMMSASRPGQADGSAMPGPSFDGLPPGLAAMLGGGASGVPGTEIETPPAKNVYAWKIAHALFSLCLGVYILWTRSFSGTLSARMRVRGVMDSEAARDAQASLFWVFVTAELGLQGARYLLEGGAVEEGMLKKVAGFLPQPWSRRVKLGSRYVGIWTTIVQDAFVVVFLLGVVAWWRG